MADYTSLITRLTSAETACRELDALVWLELGDNWTADDIVPTRSFGGLPLAPWKRINGTPMRTCMERKLRGCASAWNVPLLTHDPGTVITLIRKTLPEAEVNITFSGEDASATFKIGTLGASTYEGANLAIAMLVALFRILELKGG